jgi:hypothetical protein
VSDRKNKEKPRRLRTLVLLAILAALVLAVLYVRCGHGFGLGGGGGSGLSPGSGTGSGTAIGSGPASAAPKDAAPAPGDAAPPAHCALRIDATGITLAGAPATQDAAVAACKSAGAADVLVTGDAVQGTWDQLRASLTAAGVSVYVHGAATVDGGAASDVH